MEQLNNVTEFMAEDAIRQARVLDEYYATHKKLIGPLHGVPISTKVCNLCCQPMSNNVLRTLGTYLAQRENRERRLRGAC
jgi:hypothetical protein